MSNKGGVILFQDLIEVVVSDNRSGRIPKLMKIIPLQGGSFNSQSYRRIFHFNGFGLEMQLRGDSSLYG